MWRNESKFRFTKNLRWFSSSTAIVYMPLGNTTDESATITAYQVQLIPPKSGRLISISYKSSGTPGESIFTLHDEIAGTLATKTVTIVSGVNQISFEKGLDSGNNYFNGLGRLRIGFDPASSGSTSNVTATFEFDL